MAHITSDMEHILIGPALPAVGNRLFTSVPAHDAGSAEVRLRDELQATTRQMNRYVEDMRELLKMRVQDEMALREARRETVIRMAIASQAYDQEEVGHMARVGLFSAIVAAYLGQGPDYCEQICLAAPLRNIGKIALAPLLYDPRAKEAPYYEAHYRRHTIVGAAMLGCSSSDELRMAESIALTHHERMDGSGYPLGLSGNAIPLSGRIVGAVAAYDRSIQAGRIASPIDSADPPVHEAGGFDPAVVAAIDACRKSFEAAQAQVASRSRLGAYGLLQALPRMWQEISSPAG